MTRRHGAFPGLCTPAKRGLGLLALVTLVGLLSGCAGTGASSGNVDLANVEDAVPRAEPKSKYGNPKSYVVFGKRYHTKASAEGHVERGVASWYGRKFHGRRTSSGERYDMYAMTAAHKSLPLPTYARVTNLENGRSAVVRINDRGPFHGNRVIDLSYAAANKLGVVRHGTARVEVRAIDPRRPDSAPASENLFVEAEPATRAKPEPSSRRSAPVVAAAPKPTTKPDIEIAAASSSTAPKASAQPRATPKPNVAQTLASVDTSPRSADSVAMYLQVGAFGNRNNAEQLRRQLVDNLAENVSVRTADGSRAPLYKVHVGPLDSRSKAKDLSQKLATLGLKDAHVVVE
jgi:rare lipoprotein A